MISDNKTFIVIFVSKMSDSVNNEEEDIHTVNNVDDAINQLTNHGIVRFHGWILTPEQIDDWSIDHLDDIYELPFTREDMRSIYEIYYALGLTHKQTDEEEEDNVDDNYNENYNNDDYVNDNEEEDNDGNDNEEEDEDEEEIQEPTQTKPITKKINSKKLFKDYSRQYDSLLKYPFKSKIKYFDSSIESVQEPIVHDYKLKNAKKLCKPNFSLTPGCWEIDVMFANYFTQDDGNQYTREKTIYLTLLNVNTRYLIVRKVESRHILNYIDTIKSLIDKDVVDKGEYEFTYGPRGGEYKKKTPAHRRYVNNSMIQTLKGDGEFFKTKLSKTQTEEQNRISRQRFKKFCDEYHIKLIVDDSPYTLAHKSIDSVMRTLRNAFGLNDNRIADDRLMQQMVNYYNNTPHRNLRFSLANASRSLKFPKVDSRGKKKWIYYTPQQLQNNIDLEWQYIRMMESKLLTIKKQQSFKGLLNYKTGNIILVHLDKGKTIKSFEKKRRVFNDIAEFKCYMKGNVICRLLKPYSELIKYVNDNNYHKSEFVMEQNKDAHVMPKHYITVPIVYTKYVSNDYESIPDDYKRYFDLV